MRWSQALCQSRLQYSFPTGLHLVSVWVRILSPLLLVEPPSLCEVGDRGVKDILVRASIKVDISDYSFLLQIRKRLMVSDKGHLEWKKMYFKLSRCYPHREEYSDTLHFCTHCHILFWKVVCFFSLFILCTWSKWTWNLLVKLHFEDETEAKCNIDCCVRLSFLCRRTQTIPAQPTTQKVAPCPSPLRTLSTFSTSDTKTNPDELTVHTVHRRVPYCFCLTALSIPGCVF